ncbi:AMP-binding protein [Burkholderia anthina]|uniref:AMP-binding protein n=1 Tax=Burkholderia anthina TaxID=179879 RepID=UPI00158AD39F|nr:AMP-binding protein [Burkholderia anthina]
MNNDLFWEKSYPEALQNYVLKREALPQSVDAIATDSAKRFGTQPAFTLVLPDGAHVDMSFTEVDALSDALAAFLMKRSGLVPGDVVAIQLPNSLHYPIAAFGAWKAGLVFTNVNPFYTERELEAQLADSGAKLLIASDLFVQRAERVAARLNVQTLVASLWDFFPERVAADIRQKMQSDPLEPIATPSIDRIRFVDALEVGKALGTVTSVRHPVALYQYTGGTTGLSKGAALTHENLLSVLQMWQDFGRAYHAEFRTDDTVLTVLPLYHVFAFVINFLSFFKAGARNILVPSPRPIANLRPAFENFPVTWMAGVDTLYAGLLAELWFRANPPDLKYAVSGGTALRPTTREQWQELVCPMLEGYGLTESSCIISFTPPGVSKPGSVGLPMPGCRVRVVDDAGRLLGPGECGELIVNGPNIMLGYLNRPEETSAAVIDGWFHTGDIGMMAPDGDITIVDRKKDMVLVSGFNVYPNEIEAVIAEHPDVAEVAVIGVPDETTGEAVQAVIVPRRSTLTVEEIVRHCRERLTGYKVPKQVVFHDRLPKSSVGKILRAALRKQA